MKKYIGITTFIGFTIAFIIGLSYFTPKPDNYYYPDTDFLKHRKYNCPLDSIIDKYKVGVIDCDGDTDLQLECGDTILVIATMYYPVVGQCDDTPDITADQTKIPNIDSCSHLNWLAVSQDLLWFNDGPIHYGDTVYVIAGHKTGYYIVHDAMNRRFKNKIDFLESVGTEAYKYNEVELIINI